MKAQGHSPAAVRTMKALTRPLVRYLETQGVEVRHMDGEVLYSYQKHLLETPKENGSSRHRNSVVRLMTAAGMWCEFLVKANVLADNPVEHVKKLRQEQNLPKGLMKEAELGEYLERLGRWEDGSNLWQQRWQYRAHVIAELQYASGLRLAEVAALKEEDVDWERGIIVVKLGKGNRSRRAYLNGYALEVLKRWRGMRALVLKQNDAVKDTLFGAGAALEHTYNNLLTQIAQSMGKPAWTSHSFRHCLGYHLLRSGCKLRSIQAILGHERIKTTEVYTKVDESDTRAVLDACHPRGKA
jgi:integrase/recombinase XerD